MTLRTADDPEDVSGDRLDWMLPRPVPYSYRRMPAEERAGRGRAALRLSLLGFRARTAWGFALSPRMDWAGHLPDGYRGRLGDRGLPGLVLQRRLRDAMEREDWYVEMFGRDAPRT